MTERAGEQVMRLCVVADLEPDALMADLERLEELLLTLRGWAQEAAGPDGDGWAPPGPLAGDGAVAALNRLQRALRPTQTRSERGERLTWHEVPPVGPQWYAADGHYQLAALSFVTVAAADVALLGAVAAELGRPHGDYEVRAAIEQLEEELPPTADKRARERRGLVVTAARIHGLLDLEPTADTAALYQAWRDAGGTDAERVVLTSAQEQAYHRTVDRITAMATLSDSLTRWAMGTRDHQ